MNARRSHLLPALLLVPLLALFLTGCGHDDSGDAAPEDAGLLEPQRQAVERARDVEDDLAEAAQRQREQIEDGGG